MNDKQIIEKVERDAQRAVSVSRFLTAMPSPLSNHVFRHIIEEGIRAGSVLPQHEVARQLAESIGMHYNHTMAGSSIDLLCRLTGVPKDILYGDILSFDAGKVTDIMRRSCKMESPEEIRKLVLCMDCFSIDDATAIRDRICQKLLYVNECENIRREQPKGREEYLLPSMKTDVARNIFEELGYQTLMESWANSDEEDRNNDVLFYEWYCKGEIMDTVLDCIFAYEIPSVSRKLFAYLKDACRLDANLAEVVNEHLTSLRALDIRIPEMKLEGAPLSPLEHGEYIPALPEITESDGNGGSRAISQAQLGNLFRELTSAGYLSYESWSQFLTAFSGRGRYVKEKIEWQDSQQTLAMFLYYANGGKTSDSYCRMAMELFSRRNNGKCSLETLTRIYPDKNETVWNCFRNAGIEIEIWQKRR